MVWRSPLRKVSRTMAQMKVWGLVLALLFVAAHAASAAQATELYEFDDSEKEFAKLHPVYTRCAKA